jgi:hypothetical protein
MNERLTNLFANSKMVGKVLPVANKVATKVKGHGPEILLVGGLVSIGATVYLATKAARKHEEEIVPAQKEISDAKDILEEKEAEATERATVLAPLYGELFGRYIGLYGPAAATGVFGLYLILASHGVMKGRQKALVGTIQVLQKGYSEYRKRVVDELGEEEDLRFAHGLEQKTVVTQTKDPETGKNKKTRSKELVIPENPKGLSPYAVIFDSSNPLWQHDMSINYDVLCSAQERFNDQLRIYTHVTLNEVYRHLGIDETPAGALVGWSLAAPGDNFIDFGLDRAFNKSKTDNRFVLDFNVNGPMYQFIGEVPAED